MHCPVDSSIGFPNIYNSSHIFSHISTSASLDLLKLGANRLDIDPGAT